MLHVHRSDRACAALLARPCAACLRPAGWIRLRARGRGALPTRGWSAGLTQRLRGRGVRDLRERRVPVPARWLTGAADRHRLGHRPGGRPVAAPSGWCAPLLQSDRDGAGGWPLCRGSGGSGSSATSRGCSISRYGCCTGRSWSARWTLEGDWQARPWRACATSSRCRIPPAACTPPRAAARSDPDVVDLPARFSIFILTPPADRAAAGAAGARPSTARCTCLLHTSRRRCGSGCERPVVRARTITPASPPPQPPARLVGPGLARAPASCFGDVDSTEHPVASRQPTRAARPRCRPRVRADEPPAPGAVDSRLQVHACHGARARSRCCATRSCTLLAEDPTLEPRDVIVMCPDIETFAPLIQATFGAGEVARGRRRAGAAAPAACARRTCACGSPTARSARPTRCWASWRGCSSSAGQRVTAREVLDLADREPVRRRFRLDDDDARALRGVGRATSGIRWGLDAAAPRAVQLDALRPTAPGGRARPPAASASP